MSYLPSLVAEDLSKTYGDRVVLLGVDLVASPGRPVGVVGENGAGKSTLLRLLAGVEPIDSGAVARPTDLGYLSQDPMVDGVTTVAATLAAALAPLHTAVRRVEELACRLDDPSYVGRPTSTPPRSRGPSTTMRGTRTGGPRWHRSGSASP